MRHIQRLEIDIPLEKEFVLTLKLVTIRVSFFTQFSSHAVIENITFPIDDWSHMRDSLGIRQFIQHACEDYAAYYWGEQAGKEEAQDFVSDLMRVMDYQEKSKQRERETKSRKEQPKPFDESTFNEYRDSFTDLK